MSERSTWDLAALLLKQQRASMSECLASVGAGFADPRPGTPRAADRKWIKASGRAARAKALEGVLAAGAQFVVQLLGVAEEHARALEVLLVGQDILPVPSLTVGRSIHEALLVVCWCADPAISTEARLARAGAVTLGSAQENVRTLRLTPGNRSAELQAAIAGMADMQRYLERHGFLLRRGKDGKAEFADRVDFGGARSTTSPNITEASARYMPGTHHMWVIASGATHSRDWFTAALAGPRGQLAIMAASPVFDYCDRAIDVLGSYVGVDTGEFHRRAHVRRHALLKRAESHDVRSFVAGYDDYAAVRDRPL